LSRVANTYWVDERISSQRVLPRTASTLPSVRELSLDLIGTRTEVRRRGGVIPSWVIFGMIILATFALCVTVTIRTHAQMRTASEQYLKIQHDVDALRRGNAALERDIQRLQSDPRSIELAARSLNMARANEIVVPVE
jgi:cell division protein FtsB